MASAFLEKATNSLYDVVNYISKSEVSFFNAEAFSEMDVIADLQSGSDDRKIVAMKKIWAHFSCGGDVTNMFSEVVRNAITDNGELRRLIHLFLVSQSNLASSDAKARTAIQELGLLAVNAFRKELSDRSQISRALSIRSMSTIRVLEITPVIIEALVKLSSDHCALVRRSAAVAAAQLVEVDADQAGFAFDILSKLVGDQDPSVMGAAASGFLHVLAIYLALAEAGQAAQAGASSLEAEGIQGRGQVAKLAASGEALARLHKNVTRLALFAPRFEVAHQTATCELMALYSRTFFPSPFVAATSAHATATLPAIHPHLLPVAASLSSLLHSSSSATVLVAAAALVDIFDVPQLAEKQLGAAAGVVLRDLHNFANPLAPILKSAAAALIRTLRVAPRGSLIFVLDVLNKLAKTRPELLKPSIRSILPQARDCHATRMARLSLVISLSDVSNVKVILTAVDHEVKATQARLIIPTESKTSHAAGTGSVVPSETKSALPHFCETATEYMQGLLKLIAAMAVRFPSVRSACLEGLITLLDSASSVVAAEAVVAIKSVLQRLLAASEDSSLLSARVVRQISAALPRMSSPAARASSAWLVGAHITDVDLGTSAEALRILAVNLTEETASNVRMQALHLAVRLFSLIQDIRVGQVSGPFNPPPDPTTLGRAEMLCRLVVKISSHDRSLIIRDMARPLAALTMTPGDTPEPVKELFKRTVKQIQTGGATMSALIEASETANIAETTANSLGGDGVSSLISVITVRHAAGASALALPRPSMAYNPSGSHPPDSVRIPVRPANDSQPHVSSMASSAHARVGQGNVTSMGSGKGGNSGNRIGGTVEKSAIKKASMDANAFFDESEDEAQQPAAIPNSPTPQAVSMATPPVVPQPPPAAPAAAPLPEPARDAPAFARDAAAAANFFDSDGEDDAAPAAKPTPPVIAAGSGMQTAAPSMNVAGGVGGLGEGEEDED